jgi:lysine 2,3-aminomutase
VDFPEHLCDYARRLAEREPAFALQMRYDPREDEPDGFGPDPFGEETHASGCFGLKQRFPDRVLVMTSDRCFANCRHCTRRGLLGRAQVIRTDEELTAAVRYVKARPDVRDVLLSGGDPLTLDDEQVMRFVRAFSELEQIDVVRLCTRALCVNPGRVTPELAARLAICEKVWVNTQFNCAGELTPEANIACGLLVSAGIPVSCQTVLLKGVNDSVDKLLALFRALQRARVRPYYVFTCDPVAGISRFRVSVQCAAELERLCAERIGGLAMPRFVADLPGAKRKMPVAELAAIERAGGAK